jgi:hypothetical protein
MLEMLPLEDLKNIYPVRPLPERGATVSAARQQNLRHRQNRQRLWKRLKTSDGTRHIPDLESEQSDATGLQKMF